MDFSHDKTIPHWPLPAVNTVERFLQDIQAPSSFEYGSGYSTKWIEDRVESHTTVEHDKHWVDKVQALTKKTTIIFAPEPKQEAYFKAICRYPERHFDLVVVDGRNRVKCGMRCLDHVRPGGLFVLDDSKRKRYQELHDFVNEDDRFEKHGDYSHVWPNGEVHHATIWRRKIDR